MHKLSFKLATVEDICPLLKILKEYREFYQINSQEDGEVETFLKERFANEDSKIFIAAHESTGEVVGFIQLYPLFSTVSLKRQWMLNDLYVIESQRKKGIATQLMKLVMDHFKDKAKGFILVTSKTNVAAQQFYDKIGWKTGDYSFYTYYF